MIVGVCIFYLLPAFTAMLNLHTIMYILNKILYFIINIAFL